MIGPSCQPKIYKIYLSVIHQNIRCSDISVHNTIFMKIPNNSDELIPCMIKFFIRKFMFIFKKQVFYGMSMLKFQNKSIEPFLIDHA